MVSKFSHSTLANLHTCKIKFWPKYTSPPLNLQTCKVALGANSKTCHLPCGTFCKLAILYLTPGASLQVCKFAHLQTCSQQDFRTRKLQICILQLSRNLQTCKLAQGRKLARVRKLANLQSCSLTVLFHPN